MKRSDSELNNMFQGDYLVCLACGSLIFRHGFTPTFKKRDITNAYHDHVRSCFGLKRLIVVTQIVSHLPDLYFMRWYRRTERLKQLVENERLRAQIAETIRKNRERNDGASEGSRSVSSRHDSQD